MFFAKFTLFSTASSFSAKLFVTITEICWFIHLSITEAKNSLRLISYQFEHIFMRDQHNKNYSKSLLYPGDWIIIRIWEWWMIDKQFKVPFFPLSQWMNGEMVRFLGGAVDCVLFKSVFLCERFNFDQKFPFKILWSK